MSQSFASFRNVGVRQFETRLMNTVSQSAMPIGIKTPVAFSAGQQSFLVMNMTLEEQIQDNFRNLVLTNHGERLVLFDYGANIGPLAAEYNSEEEFDAEVMVRINTAVAKYMPFIQLEGYRSEAQYHDNRYTGVIKIYIQYSVPRANIGQKILEVTIYAI